MSQGSLNRGGAPSAGAYDRSLIYAQPVQQTPYGISGGYENNVWIRNEFPPEAPLEGALPEPDEVAKDRLTAWRSVGDLARGDVGTIAATGGLTDTLPFSASIAVWDGIYKRVGQLRGETCFEFTIPPARLFLPLLFRDDDSRSVAQPSHPGAHR